MASVCLPVFNSLWHSSNILDFHSYINTNPESYYNKTEYKQCYSSCDGCLGKYLHVYTYKLTLMNF